MTNEPRRSTKVALKAVTVLSAILTFVFLISFVFSDRGIAELDHARKRVTDLHTGISRLETDNAHLQAEIDSVRRSTYAVERIAREDLGMSKKGEVIYLLPKRSAAAA